MTTPPFPFDPFKKLEPNQPIQPVKPIHPSPPRPLVKPEVIKPEPEPHQPDQFNKEESDFNQKAQKLTRPKEFGHKMTHPPLEGIKQTEDSPSQLAKETLSKAKEARGSDFEETLDKVFTGKKADVPSLPQGKRASFAPKPDSKWVTFFKNVLSLGSVEKQATQSTTSITQGLYRGTYQQDVKSKLGSTLVSDLHLIKEGEKSFVEKFARVLVDNPTLLQTFGQMQPGDVVPKEVFSRLGQEVNYTQLVHVPEGEVLQTTEQQLKLLKSPVGFESQQRLERQFKEERLKHQETRSLQKDEKKEEGEGTPFYFWGDPRFEKQPRLGKPKFWIFFTFGVAAILLILLFLTLFR